jgi:simple sugar transport system permease protein
VDVLFKIATIEAAIRLGLPVALAALGAIISERSGVLNLGLEGMMLSGALGGYMANEATGSPWLGLLVGLLVGAFAGAILAGLVVSMRTNQVVTGIAFTLVAAAVTTYLFQLRWSIGDVPPRVQRLGMTPLIIVTLVCLVSVWFLFHRTTIGLAIAAVGESPASADALGYPVVKLRWMATMAGGALAGLGGSVLVNGPLGLFIEGVTAGRGWVALALVVFAGWKPFPAVAGAFLFGLCDAAQLRLQGTATEVPYEVFLALPYVVTLIALVLRARVSRTPSALGVPYVRGVS